MFKRLSYIINFILLVLIIYIVMGLSKIGRPLLIQVKSAKDEELIAKRFVVKNKDIEVIEIELPDFTPASRSRYALIADKDLFRPEREEWYPPPPPEEEGETLEAPSTLYGRQQKLDELPKPILSGVVIIGENKKYAIMQGHVREEVEVSQKAKKRRVSRRTSHQPRLRVKQDKAKPYHIGDEVSEYQIVDILENMVIVEKNGKREEILLRKDLIVEGLDGGDGEMGFAQPGVPPGYNPQVPFPPGFNPQGAYPRQGMVPQGAIPGQRFQPGMAPGQLPGQRFQPGMIPGQRFQPGVPPNQFSPQTRNWPAQGQSPLGQFPASGQPFQRSAPFPQTPPGQGYPPQGGLQNPFFQLRGGGVPGGGVPPNNYNLDQPLEQDLSY